jgi:hypothetical protein
MPAGEHHQRVLRRHVLRSHLHVEVHWKQVRSVAEQLFSDTSPFVIGCS